MTITSELTTVRRRPTMRGGQPITIPGKTGGSPSHPQKYPSRAKLSPQAGDVLALLVRPRSMLEVADALGIESPLARHHLDALVRRELLVEIAGYPVRWEAV